MVCTIVSPASSLLEAVHDIDHPTDVHQSPARGVFSQRDTTAHICCVTGFHAHALARYLVHEQVHLSNWPRHPFGMVCAPPVCTPVSPSPCVITSRFTSCLLSAASQDSLHGSNFPSALIIGSVDDDCCYVVHVIVVHVIHAHVLPVLAILHVNKDAHCCPSCIMHEQ